MRRHGEAIVSIRADNPGPLTLSGTETYVIGRERVVVLDPGPEAARHLQRVDAVVAGRSGQVVLTHAHADHAAAAATATRRWGELCASQATLDRVGLQGRVLKDGEDLPLGGGRTLKVLETPGHTADHLSFLLEPDRALFTGDLVLGTGSTVIMHPEGTVRDALESLQKLRALSATRLYPAHGPPVQDPRGKFDERERHWRSRIDAVRTLAANAEMSARGLVRALYGPLPEAYFRSAEFSMAAYQEYVRTEREAPSPQR